MKRALYPWITVATCVLGARTVATAEEIKTLDQVIARHVEARGGAERWSAIERLSLAGSMTYLSQTGDFTLWLDRSGKYLLERREHGQTMTTGYDGQIAWRGNVGDPGASQRIAGVDRAMIVRDADFPTPLFDYEAKGYKLRLIGKAMLDDKDAIAIAVDRNDGYEETWYLDPQTYLDIGLDSPGSFFGDRVPMRTYHDDFKTVSGLTLPFRIESQWNVQERVLTIAKVDIDPPIEPARFSPPKPQGMEPLQSIVGQWNVVASVSAHPGAPWRDSQRTSTIEQRVGGALLEEHYTTASGQEVVRSYTYDRFRKEYRVTEISDASNYLDVAEGTFEQDGRLVVSNVTTGTAVEGLGHTVHVRMIVADIAAGSFRVEREISTDGGATWTLAAKSTYTRVGG
jgi:Protein of unknown function (DUF1579)